MDPIEDRNPKDWVQARINCTTAGVLACLRVQVGHDVSERNRLREQSEHPRLRYVLKDDEQGDFRVEVLATTHGKEIGQKLYASFFKSDSNIEVRTSQCDSFTVSHHWNQETVTCELYIGEKRYDLWQISQKALYDLFFPSYHSAS